MTREVTLNGRIGGTFRRIREARFDTRPGFQSSCCTATWAKIGTQSVASLGRRGADQLLSTRVC